ncbi:hypothetical protein P692DRAFT_20867152 [Suillus brevipes Sb2]|nr:hypothetical protein P692DRAFT_20867152 [Suillus brevipes Sb2]
MLVAHQSRIELRILHKTVEFAHPQNQKVGVQIAHAGRKASTVSSRLRVGRAATESTSGWSDIIWGFSTVPFDDASLVLKELSKAQIKAVVIVFVEAAKRALKANSDVIEIHGYLLFSFSSPIAEQDPHRRMWRKLSIRLNLLGVVDVIRDVVPEDLHATLPESFCD